MNYDYYIYTIYIIRQETRSVLLISAVTKVSTSWILLMNLGSIQKLTTNMSALGPALIELGAYIFNLVNPP